MSCNIIERNINKTEALNTRIDEGGGGVNIYIFCEGISVKVNNAFKKGKFS